MPLKVWLPSIIVTGLAANAIYLLYRLRIPHKILHLVSSSAPPSSNFKLTSKKKSFHEVIFFPDRQYLCKYFVFSNGKHCGSESCTYSHSKDSSFFQLTKHLLKTQKTLDVCVYTICHELLADIMIELQKQRGVLVRIITDDEALTSSNCQICRLKTAGIEVRIDLTNTLMHHKFVLVDRKLLINGSFNWSFNGVTRNNDNVLITDEKELVNPYNNEFDKLWELFDPVNRSLLDSIKY
ncbi:mitochondrial cardiolipin hydrolase-like [Amphiura filiformis]|uniref:mitochondrial cardiolipin hydrolase-like n=1 Tax=Amphiura filiformis TaxID=82378 RepID=UPI003B21F6AB